VCAAAAAAVARVVRELVPFCGVHVVEQEVARAVVLLPVVDCVRADHAVGNLLQGRPRSGEAEREGRGGRKREDRIGSKR